MKVYKRLAQVVGARLHCIASDNETWVHNHTRTLAKLEREYLPYGSGFDNGCYVDLEASNEDKLVILWGYHAMDEHGYYSGWVRGDAIVTPHLAVDFSVDFGTIEDDTDLCFYDDETDEIIPASADEYGLLEYVLDTLSAALSEEIES